VGRGFTGRGKSQLKAAFSSTGTLACAGFAALIVDAQPRVAVLLDFFHKLFSRDKHKCEQRGLQPVTCQQDLLCFRLGKDISTLEASGAEESVSEPGSVLCSARLQAGMCLHPRCRPEGRRHKSASRTGRHTDSEAPIPNNLMSELPFLRQAEKLRPTNQRIPLP